MDLTLVRMLATVACFAIFIGVVIWVVMPANRERFREAAQLPFALDDDRSAGNE